MILLASAPLPSPTLNFKAKAFASGSWSRAHGPVLLRSRFQKPPFCFIESSSAQYGESDKFRNQLVVISERVRGVVPKSLREFPWREAERLLAERLISLGTAVLKWSFVACFAISFSSDFLTSMSTNQELMLPLGLLIGCLSCGFLKETANEMLPDSEGKGLNWQFFSIGCFFILVKVLSTFSGLRTREFLLHFGNGGILQLLWLFRRIFWTPNGTVQPNLPLDQNTSLPKNASEIDPPV